MNILAYVHLRNIYRSTGAGRVARNIVEQLVDHPSDDVRILADRNDYQKVILKVGKPWSEYRYNCFERDTSAQQRRWFFLDLPRAEQFWSDVQIMYCAGKSYVPSKLARSVILLHDAAFFDDWADQGQHLSYYLQQFKWRLLFGKLSKKVDLFHTVSNFSAERILYHFPSFKDRIRVIPNGVTEFFFADNKTEDREILAKRNLAGRCYVLLPGGLSRRKNADLVLQAWPLLRQLHRDLRLVVTSYNDAAYVARAASNGDSVVMTGFVDDAELRALYRGARVVWFPSCYEGFGIPVLEAMACGTPVVASNASSLPEVTGNAASLMPTRDVGAHVAGIDYLLKDDAARDMYSARGRDRAAMFTWSEAARKLRSVFAELI